MTYVELRQTVAALRQSLEAKDFEASYGPDAIGRMVAFIQAVEALTEPDADDTMPVLDVKSQQSIFTAAAQLQRTIAADRAIVSTDMSSFNSDRERVSDIVALFTTLDASKNQTVEQAITANERISATVSGEVKKMGGASSSRNLISISNGNGTATNGFFTNGDRKVNFDPNGTTRRMLEAAAQKNKKDPVYQAFIAHLLNPDKPYGPGLMNALVIRGGYGEKTDPTVSEDFAKTAFSWEHMIKEGYFSYQEIVTYLKNKNVQTLIGDIYATIDWSKQRENIVVYSQYANAEVGIRAEFGSPVPMRNVAMSRVATLLGKPNLIARSIPVTVERDGVKSTGVFMEQAQGETAPENRRDRKQYHADIRKSKFGHMPPEPFTASAFKDMADIEIIDFICGNVDRHQGNLTYKFDDTHHIIGVQGIDNDLSFGTRVPKSTEHLQNGTALHSINVITKEMAQTVLNLEPETLRAALTDTGLKETEIEASVIRLNQMKRYLVESAKLEQSGNVKADASTAKMQSFIHVMTEDEWKAADLGELAISNSKEFNIFGNGISIERLGQIAGHHTEAEESKQLDFTPAERVDDLKEEKLDDNERQISDLYTEMKNSVTRFHKCKENFQEILNAAGEVIYFRKTDENGTIPDVINNPADSIAYVRLLERLAEAVKTYKETKLFEIGAHIDTGSTGKKRCELAVKLEKIVLGQLTSVREAILERNEKSLAEAAEETEKARGMEERLGIVSTALVDRIMADGSTMEREQVTQIVEQGITLDTMVKDEATLNTLVALAEENPEELFRQYKETNRAIREGKNATAAAEAAEEQLAHQAPEKKQPEEVKAPVVAGK